MAIKSIDIGKEFIDILGLPKETIWFEIKFHVDELVKVKCESYIDDKLVLEGVLTKISEYELVEIKKEK